MGMSGWGIGADPFGQRLHLRGRQSGALPWTDWPCLILGNRWEGSGLHSICRVSVFPRIGPRSIATFGGMPASILRIQEMIRCAARIRCTAARSSVGAYGFGRTPLKPNAAGLDIAGASE